MATRASRRPPIVLRVPREALYAAIVVVFLYATAEIVLRVQHAITDARRGARPYSIRSVTRSGVAYARDDGQIALVTDPHLVYRLEPGRRNDAVTINADGFRGADWRHEKEPGTRRVVVLGGSAAFGVGASADAKVFTAVLEKELDTRAAARGQHVEVWNASVLGYDSTQELVLLATKLVELAPDVVLLFDGWNDFNHSGALSDRLLGLEHPKFCEIDALLARRGEVVLGVLRRLHLFESLESGVRRWTAKLADGGEGKGTLGQFTDRSATGVPHYQRNLRAMIRLARSYGAVPILVAQPELYQRRDPPAREAAMRAKKETDGYGAYARAAYPKFVAGARAVAAAEAAPFLDATTLFDGRPEAFFTDTVHVDDLGHELLAAFLAPAIESAIGGAP